MLYYNVNCRYCNQIMLFLAFERFFPLKQVTSKIFQKYFFCPHLRKLRLLLINLACRQFYHINDQNRQLKVNINLFEKSEFNFMLSDVSLVIEVVFDTYFGLFKSLFWLDTYFGLYKSSSRLRFFGIIDWHHFYPVLK